MLIILMSLTDGMVQPPQTSDQMRNLAYAYNAERMTEDMTGLAEAPTSQASEEASFIIGYSFPHASLSLSKRK